LKAIMGIKEKGRKREEKGKKETERRRVGR
jgi:hypothetical protein